MTTAVQRRRGTTTEHASFTGLEGEISVNTTKDTLVVHDGSTAGGFELARADGSNFVATSVDINGGTIDGTSIGVSSASTGAFTTLTASGEITANGGIALGDNDKATFGAGDDLQIYHSGAHSFISDAGTGNLYLSAADSFIVRTEGVAVSATFTPTAGVDLNYAGAAKLATTATGIDVTGIALLTGVNQHALTIKSDLGTGTYEIGRNQSTGVLEFKGTETTYNGYLFKGPSSDLMTINASGQVGVGTSSPNEKAHLHGGSSATRLRISGGALSQTYGGFIEGEGVSGQGGYLRLGVVDNGINKVSMEIEPQGNQLSFSTASSERMRIDPNGRVGIGTSSPTRPLEVSDSTGDGSGGVKISSYLPTLELDDISGGGTSFILQQDGANTLFKHDSTERMRINASGNVGIGTTVPYTALDVSGGTTNQVAVFRSTDTTATIGFADDTTPLTGNLSYVTVGAVGNNMVFNTNLAEAMRIDSSGQVGIGTSSPSSALTVAVDDATGDNGARIVGTTDGNKQLRLAYNTTGNYANIQAIHAGTAYTNLALQKDGGNVGIGTSSPASKLHLNSSSTTAMTFDSDTSTQQYELGVGYGGVGASSFYLYDNTANASRMVINSSGNVGIGYTTPAGKLGVAGAFELAGTGDVTLSTNPMIARNNDNMLFGTSATERMRIDSSGNLLVGTTDAAVGVGNTNTGHSIGAAGYAAHSRSANASLFLNRTSSDGEIARFSKDGAAVGSIGAEGGDLVIGTGSTAGLQFNDATPTVRPWNMSANSRTDGVCDLGYSNARFKDLYLSGGVYLGGIGAPNKLDDYEEGTWTPVIVGSTGGAYTYSLSAAARYTKIGNLVTLSVAITNITTSGSGHSGYIQIQGAPFTKNSNTFATGALELSSAYMGSGQTFATVSFITAAASNVLYVKQSGDNSGGADLLVTGINSGNTDINFTITYQTA